MVKQTTGGAVATLFAAFVAGGLVAWGISTPLRGASAGDAPGAGSGWPPWARADDRPAGLRWVLARRLALTNAQQDSLQAILERHRPQAQALWRRLGPEFDSLRSAVDSEIGAQLTPAQRTRFLEMRRRQRERFRGTALSSEGP